MSRERTKSFARYALVFLAVVGVACYLKYLASQFTCLYFGHHICAGHSTKEISYTLQFSEFLRGLLWFSLISLAAMSVTMSLVRLFCGRWRPFPLWLLVPWAPFYGFYYTHFVVFGDLLESLLPAEPVAPVAAYPLAAIALVMTFAIIPALPLIAVSVLIERLSKPAPSPPSPASGADGGTP